MEGCLEEVQQVGNKQYQPCLKLQVTQDYIQAGKTITMTCRLFVYVL